MSYLNQAQDPRRRAAALAGTVAVHALLGVAVVTGLTIAGYKQFEERTPIIDFPVADPPPPEQQELTPRPDTKLPPAVAPLPSLDLQTEPLPDRQVFDEDTPLFPEVPRDLGGDVVAPPTPPAPLFTPRGARPSNDRARWISNEDYPSRALRDAAEGMAAYRLVVGTNGRVASCEVTRSTGNGQLDDATCDFIARRARFEAATDETGAKVVGVFTGTVKWQIPD